MDSCLNKILRFSFSMIFYYIRILIFNFKKFIDAGSIPKKGAVNFGLELVLGFDVLFDFNFYSFVLLAWPLISGGWLLPPSIFSKTVHWIKRTIILVKMFYVSFVSFLFWVLISNWIWMFDLWTLVCDFTIQYRCTLPA